MSNTTVQTPKRAAIEVDENGADRDLGQISAKDFLTVLDKEGLGASSLTLLPEKKKYELYAEPEWNRAVKVKDMVRVLKAEKKKVELEIPLDLNSRIPMSYVGHTTFANGGTSYPTDDNTRLWPPQIEMRKASLDHRFDVFSRQLMQLNVTIQELAEKLEQVTAR